MKLRIMSDLHLEFEEEGAPAFNIPPLGDDTVLVLAGDICVWETHRADWVRLIHNHWSLYKAIIIVAGNHEFYNQGDVAYTMNEMKEAFKMFENVHFLDDEWLILDDVVFIGSTMWTDLNQRNPGTLWHVLSRLNDFSQITVEGERLNPDLFWGLNKMAKVFLQNALDTFSEHKRVVVTHHLPSRRSVPLRYQERPENWGYVCEMDEMILDNGPDLWIHGHTHDSMDYPIGNTRIICNPRGYVDEGGNPKFNMNLEVEI